MTTLAKTQFEHSIAAGLLATPAAAQWHWLLENRDWRTA